MSHLDMFIEFMEIKMMRDAKKQAESNDLNDDMILLGVGTDRTKVVKKMSQKEVDQEYDDLDISQFGPQPVKTPEKPKDLI